MMWNNYKRSPHMPEVDYPTCSECGVGVLGDELTCPTCFRYWEAVDAQIDRDKLEREEVET
jgi:hypothetical protein